MTEHSPIEPGSGHVARMRARGVFGFLAVVVVLSGCARFETSHDTAWTRDAPGADDAAARRPIETYHRVVRRGAESIAPAPVLASHRQDCAQNRTAPREAILRPDFAAARDAYHATSKSLETEIVCLSEPAAAAARQPAEAPISFPLYFALDSDRLTAAGHRAIDTAVIAARKIGATDFAITGHAGLVGPDPRNMESALRRAKAVSAALVARGINPARISVANQIEAESTVATAGDLGELTSRRVDIMLLGQY